MRIILEQSDVHSNNWWINVCVTTFNKLKDRYDYSWQCHTSAGLKIHILE